MLWHTLAQFGKCLKSQPASKSPCHFDTKTHIHVAAKVELLDADSVRYPKYSVSGHCHNGKGKGKVHPRRGHEGPEEE
jgi:hypothetical protein